MFLPTGQKFRFLGRHGLDRARACAAELQGACIRTGAEIEMTADREAHFGPVTSSNGFHVTPLAERKLEKIEPINAWNSRAVDFR